MTPSRLTSHQQHAIRCYNLLAPNYLPLPDHKRLELVDMLVKLDRVPAGRRVAAICGWLAETHT